MGSWTMFGREGMLGAYLTPDTVVPLGALQVALTRSIPVANAAANQLIEPNTGGYARAAYYANGAHWSPTGFGEYANSLPIVFPEITASWGLIVGWALIDPVSGQCITVGEIADPYVAEMSTIAVISPGVLVLGSYD